MVGVGIVTLGVTVVILGVELWSVWRRWRVGIVWRTLDECMRVGYEVKDRPGGPEAEDAWEWHDRVAQFSEAALGYHAMRKIREGWPPVGEVGVHGERFIQHTLTQIHEHIAGKVVDERLRPGLRVRRWKGWTPERELPAVEEGVEVWGRFRWWYRMGLI